MSVLSATNHGDYRWADFRTAAGIGTVWSSSA
jgi:hypothetical protein